MLQRNFPYKIVWGVFYLLCKIVYIVFDKGVDKGVDKGALGNSTGSPVLEISHTRSTPYILQS